MTTLAIMATYEKKRLKCYGTVAAGEHVAVTVTDGAQWIGEGKALRLRVLFGPDTVAVFPFAEGDTWTATGTQNADAYCELNLNTLQAEKYLKHGGTCLWILDDVENHTLYATGEFDVLPWPKRRGIDEPIDLDGYPLLLDEINGLREEFEAYQQTVSQMLAAKQDTIFDLATIRSGAAAGATAVQPAQIARFVDDAEYKAQYGEQNKPAILFKHGTNVIVALDATPFVKDGMVSSVEIEDGNLVITFNTDAGQEPIEIPLTDIFDPDNYYDKDAVDNLLDDKQDALTFDNAPTTGSNNPVKSGGIWSAIWGALAALPTGFTSLYDWCVSQLAGKLDKSAVVAPSTSASDSGKAADAKATGDALALKANDNAVVKLTGDQTIGGDKRFTGYDNFYDFTVSHPQGMGYIRIHASANENRVRIEFYDAVTGSQGELFLPVLGVYSAVTLAAIENIAPDAFLMLYDGATVDLNTLYCYQGRLYRCVLGYTFQSGDSYPSDDTTHWALATVEDVLAALRTAIAGKADVSAIPYALVTKTISNGAVSLDDRAINAVAVSSSLALLTVNFPTATSGKVRDFAMRLNIAAGVTAPEIAWPQGVTLENNGGEVPEIADGGTGGSSTILYFSESENDGTTAKFLVKGEALTAITQA